MSKYYLLTELKDWIEDITKDMKFGVDVQKSDTENSGRAPEVHRMRLPNSAHLKKYAPYILIQYIAGSTVQPEGRRSSAKATVRMIFCVYNEDEEEGALELLNLIETVERELLADPFFKQFYLDRESELADLIYQDDTRPFYAGELVATFVIKETERNVNEWLRK